MEVYNLIIRRNKKEDEIITITVNGKYQAIKEATEQHIKELKNDFNIYQIRLIQDNKLDVSLYRLQ